eukprot:5250845-Pyramimonas_sp.AAC.1
MSSAHARTSPRPASSVTRRRWHRNGGDAIAHREPDNAQPCRIPLRTQQVDTEPHRDRDSLDGLKKEPHKHQNRLR